MTKIIICQLRILPRFTDIHRNPLIVREKFGPAMVTLDLSLFFVGWNRCADCETRGYLDASRQRDEVRVEITTIACASIARIDRVSAAPTTPRFFIKPTGGGMGISQDFFSLCPR